MLSKTLFVKFYCSQNPLRNCALIETNINIFKSRVYVDKNLFPTEERELFKMEMFFVQGNGREGTKLNCHNLTEDKKKNNPTIEVQKSRS